MKIETGLLICKTAVTCIKVLSRNPVWQIIDVVYFSSKVPNLTPVRFMQDG